MNDSGPNGDIGSAPAESATAPVAATTEATPAIGAAPTSGQVEPQGSLTTEATNPESDPPGWAPSAYKRFQESQAKAKELSEWRQGLEQSWGEILRADPQQIRTAVDLVRRMQADPVAHVTQLFEELQGDERFRPQIASQAARFMNGLRRLQPAEEPEPQPDLVAENGTPVFSAPQLRKWQEWYGKQSERKFESRLNEAMKPLAEIRQERQAAALRQQSEAQAARQYKQAQTWHGFKEHEAEIAKVFDANPEWSLQDAYLHILHTKILPTIPAKAQAQVVADLQSKAAAQTLNPSSTTRPSTPDFKGDFKAALEFAAGKR